MFKKLLTIVSVAAAAFAAGHFSGASAQSLDLEKRLAAAKSLDCRFTALATGTWDDTTAKPKATVSTTKLEAKFVDINVDEGTAEASGDFGKSFISVRYTNGYLHLMQISDAGPLRVTTVLAQESTKGRFKAVQTRHEYTSVSLPGFTSRPEMYIGDCAVGT